jgi:hypothetical protein
MFTEPKTKHDAIFRVAVGLVGILAGVINWALAIGRFIWQGTEADLFAAAITAVFIILLCVCVIVILDGLRALKRDTWPMRT